MEDKGIEIPQPLDALFGISFLPLPDVVSRDDDATAKEKNIIDPTISTRRQQQPLEKTEYNIPKKKSLTVKICQFPLKVRKKLRKKLGRKSRSVESKKKETISTSSAESTPNNTSSTPALSPHEIPSSLDIPEMKIFIRVDDLELPNNIVNCTEINTLNSYPRATSSISSSDFCEISIIPDTTSRNLDIINALSDFGLRCISDDSEHVLWTPTDDTRRILAKETTIPGETLRDPNDICVWGGQFLSSYNYYGSKLPMAKSRGIINTSPYKLLELILDSDRVNEYNKMSLGRKDVHIFNDNPLDDDDDKRPGVPSEGYLEKRDYSKIIRTLSKPPLIRKPIEFVTLIHVRKLPTSKDNNEEEEEGPTYLLSSRAVILEDKTGNKYPIDDGEINTEAIRSEMLLGINILRPVKENKETTEFTNISLMYSSIVPMLVAKKIGLTSVGNFMKDIQAVFP